MFGWYSVSRHARNETRFSIEPALFRRATPPFAEERQSR